MGLDQPRHACKLAADLASVAEHLRGATGGSHARLALGSLPYLSGGWPHEPLSTVAAVAECDAALLLGATMLGGPTRSWADPYACMSGKTGRVVPELQEGDLCT